MDKLIPIIILIVIIIVGFISKKIELSTIVKRIKFTTSYRNKFIQYINEIISEHHFNQNLYCELTSEVKEMQYELGEDGIFAFMTDLLKGVSVRNYQLLINFLPETREMLNGENSFILTERYNKSINDCDDMFIRHLGTLEKEHESIKQGLFNPFSSFSEGIKTIIMLPILLLNWFGFVSTEKTHKAKDSIVVKALDFIVTILSFAATIITIVVGWNDFWRIVFNLFK